MRKKIVLSLIVILAIVLVIFGYNNLSGSLEYKKAFNQDIQNYCEDLQTKDLFYLDGTLMALDQEDQAVVVDLEQFENCKNYFPAEYI